MDLVRSIGAHHVLDYTREDFAAGPHRYDVILDIGGNSPLSRLRRALTPRGTLVIVGGEDGGRWTGMSRQTRALALSPFVAQRLTNYGQNPVDYSALTRDVGRLLLGKNLQCCECHDHLFIEEYKLIIWSSSSTVQPALCLGTPLPSQKHLEASRLISLSIEVIAVSFASVPTIHR